MRQIGQALSDAVTLRGGSLTKDVLKLYAQKLAKHPIEDVLNALQKLGDQKRADFELALPEIGVLFALVDIERVARMNRSTAAKSERLVRWQCIENPAHTLSGFPAADADLNRRCQGIPKTRRTDWKPEDGKPICGAKMAVVHDDNEISDSGPMERFDMPWADRSGAR